MKLTRIEARLSPMGDSKTTPLPGAHAFGDDRRGSRQSRGYGADWDRTRARILVRDGYRCQCEECKAAGLLTPATDVDHRIARADGGSEDDDNLQAMGHECHKRKTAAENAARRAGVATAATTPREVGGGGQV